MDGMLSMVSVDGASHKYCHPTFLLDVFPHFVVLQLENDTDLNGIVMTHHKKTHILLDIMSEIL